MIVDIAGIAIEVHPTRPFVQSILEPFATSASPQVEIPSSTLEQKTAELDGTTSPDGRPIASQSYALLELVHNALVDYDCMLFHCALVKLDDVLYAIAGPSGAGKSTIARLWHDHLGATIVNGDKPFLRKTAKGWHAASSPWTGKEMWGEPGHFAPLHGICFVAQSENNTIKRLDPAQAAEHILRQTHMPDTYSGARALLDLVDSLAMTVPVYYLQGNATEATAELSRRTMTNG